MKTVIASIIALTVAAPAFADVQKTFALTNDSPAENVVHVTSQGDKAAALWAGVNANESAAEQNIVLGGGEVSRDVVAFLSLSNDSPAENLK